MDREKVLLRIDYRFINGNYYCHSWANALETSQGEFRVPEGYYKVVALIAINSHVSFLIKVNKTYCVISHTMERLECLFDRSNRLIVGSSPEKLVKKLAKLSPDLTDQHERNLFNERYNPIGRPLHSTQPGLLSLQDDTYILSNWHIVWQSLHPSRQTAQYLL